VGDGQLFTEPKALGKGGGKLPPGAKDWKKSVDHHLEFWFEGIKTGQRRPS